MSLESKSASDCTASCLMGSKASSSSINKKSDFMNHAIWDFGRSRTEHNPQNLWPDLCICRREDRFSMRGLRPLRQLLSMPLPRKLYCALLPCICPREVSLLPLGRCLPLSTTPKVNVHRPIPPDIPPITRAPELILMLCYLACQTLFDEVEIMCGSPHRIYYIRAVLVGCQV